MKATRILYSTALALSLAMAGCMQPMTPELAAPGIQIAAPGEGTVTARMHLAVQDVASRQLLAMPGMEPWVKADIHHVKLSLYQGESNLLVTTPVNQAELAGTVTFTNLQMNTDYRVVAQAWADESETQPIDAGATDLASCTTSFSTGTTALVYVGALRLKLKNKTFSGSTTGSMIQVTDGILEDTTDGEAVAIVVPPPALAEVTPASGSTLGGNSVTLTGTNLAGATGVTFGGEPATITANTATSVTVTPPPGASGTTVAVVVTTPGGSATYTGTYLYAVLPSAGPLSPNSGPVAGGTSISLYGSNLSEVHSVTVGGVYASFTVITPTMLVFQLPAGAAGAAEVVVTSQGGSSTAMTSFTYMNPPTVTTMTPTSGSSLDGDSVTFTGTDLAHVYSVTFGGVEASISETTATTVTVTVPESSSVGTVDVVLTNPAGSAMLVGAYTYTP